MGKHRPETVGRLRLGSADNQLWQLVNISAVVSQLVNIGLLIHERRESVSRGFGVAVVASAENIA